MKKFFNKKGYTIIELLAVIVILVAVGTIITSILVTTLRNGGRSNTVNDVRQNGNYIIVQMSKMIAFSRSFDGVSTDGVNFTSNCVVTNPPAPTPTPAPIAYSYIKITSFDGGKTVFSCSGGTIASNGASLINASDLNVTSCAIYCNQTSNLAVPSLDIKFTLQKRGAALFVENQAIIPFETSVTPRNN
jgi:type II secretory pathway pseudopilin PulG